MLESRDYLILFLASLIIILDIYIMVLDKKVRKLQDSVRGMAAANKDMAESQKEACKLFTQLANVTKSVNREVNELVGINKYLCDVNQKLINNIKEKGEGK